MGRNSSHDKLSNKVGPFPKVFIDKENDFAAIKIALGIEYKSYEKDEFIFCEDKACLFAQSLKELYGFKRNYKKIKKS